MKKLLSIVICILIIIPLLTTTVAITTQPSQIPQNITTDALTFYQIDFLYPEATMYNSNWGTLIIDIHQLLEQENLDEGFLNIMTDTGWVLQNHFINQVPGHQKLSIDFNLGNTIGTDVTLLSIHKEFTENPVVNFEDGVREIFLVDDIIVDCDGTGDGGTTQVEKPMPYLNFNVSVLTFSYTKPLQAGENVQCAANQCFPMAVANSLQYLENNYMNVLIPHDHIPGLKGDNSLVGQLDFFSNRYVVNRSEGDGLNNTEMLIGKFEYLDSIGLSNVLIHKHQGDGKNQLDPPLGDFTHMGITSIDESINGNVTFDWLYEQLKNCSDVEIGYFKDGGGGHAVRVVGCGKTYGQPWIRYIHDSLQTSSDPNDQYGLAEQQVYVTDLDGDGMMNVGSESKEIGFALSETGKSAGIIGVSGGFGLAVDIINFGPLTKPDLSWSITLKAPFILFGRFTEGKIDVPAHETVRIKSTIPFGLGLTQFIITAGDVEALYHGFLIGPLTIPFKEL